jgi:hypothetical protein
LEVSDAFQPFTFALWHDTSALDYCIDWLSKNEGIVWTRHTFFGRELSRRTGLSYFGQMGRDQKGRPMSEEKGPCIASIAANGTGRNLQHYHHNLITSCPTGAALIEQLLARTHRPGQRADEVTAEILVGCIEHIQAWTRAVAEAEMARDMFGAPQKILVADVNMPKENDPRLGRDCHRWRKSTSQKGDEG